MGADPTAFAVLYRHLAKGFDKLPDVVKKDRKATAKVLRLAHDDVDFNDDDLDEWEALIVLGIAKRCSVCNAGYTDWNMEDHGSGVCG